MLRALRDVLVYALLGASLTAGFIVLERVGQYLRPPAVDCARQPAKAA